ncbi:MAG: amidohydrolase family protein [Gemmatimonadetes bacterium]|nr:amidohydrolase family protein [Gemmatimonadota bacterium]
MARVRRPVGDPRKWSVNGVRRKFDVLGHPLGKPGHQCPGAVEGPAGPVQHAIALVVLEVDVARADADRVNLRRSQESILRLHEAGVPIVVGSDSPGNPWVAYGFHGISTIREMELLEEAGLSPSDVLQAATRVSAEMLGLQGEIGTIEVGKRADLVIVRENPLQHIRALRSIEWTVRDGVARTPVEWITGSP